MYCVKLTVSIQTTYSCTKILLRPWCKRLLSSVSRKPQVSFRAFLGVQWKSKEHILHYIDVIMTTMASQITSLTVVYSTVYSDADLRKHQSSASLAFVWGIHRCQVTEDSFEATQNDKYSLPRCTLSTPSIFLYKTHLSRQFYCWSLKCSWSITCRRCSNYIVLDWTPGFNRLH